VTYDGEEGPVAIPVEGASVQAVAAVGASSGDKTDDDTVSIVSARQQQVQIS
jgi:hypothetical protein